ncbi:RDD family protein [Nocardioides sp. GXQ0305]|uniref:RDD family protein n=1 Tax=Nocardioides sp. GXQ0305 TaxID=3423912 RepID=UPI003D7DE533
MEHGPTTPDGQPLSGWWWRVLAVVVDSLVIWIVNVIATLPVQLEVQREQQAYQLDLQERVARGEQIRFSDFWGPMGEQYADHVLALVVFPIVLLVCYHAGMLRWRGATLGKLLCRLRVRPRSADGRLSWDTIGLRLGVQFGPGFVALVLLVATGSFTWFLLVQVFALLFYAVDSLTALGERRQTIHDRAAGTVVVRMR